MRIMSEHEQLFAEKNKINMFSILQNGRRRHMIEYLKSCDHNLTFLDVVVERLIEVEKGASNAKDLRRSIKISFLQTHIPLLERAGVVSYNEHTKEIRLIKIPTDVTVHMNLLNRADISYEFFYLAVSLTGIVSILLDYKWIAVTALAGIFIGALVQKKGKLLLKGENRVD